MSLLLDRLTVYGETLAIAMATLGSRTVTEDDLRRAVMPFAEGDEALRELVTYLRDVGLVESRRTGSKLRATVDPRRDDLRLHILSWLRTTRDENTVVLDLYGWLLQEDDFAGRLLERDQVWPLYNQARERQRRDGGGGVVLNSPKTGSWLRLMTYLGLVRPERSNSFVLAPALETLRLLLARVDEAFEGGDISLVAATAWIEEQYCPILSRPDRVQRGFADALELLEELGYVRLGIVGDAAALWVNQRRVSQIARTTARCR